MSDNGECGCIDDECMKHIDSRFDALKDMIVTHDNCVYENHKELMGAVKACGGNGTLTSGPLVQFQLVGGDDLHGFGQLDEASGDGLLPEIRVGAAGRSAKSLPGLPEFFACVFQFVTSFLVLGGLILAFIRLGKETEARR
ncbi:hypothetical protein G1C95_1133 [Bifidobacterium sp. DSM 109957]|uniref:Uncharacterized protein n=1 Tax=Bifidobacterium oedipodis TaxID=2675322 RepID=A0A7Y0HSE9_9BIFI|nr:hypothetical protein [Bifidobacterium sp. DSM 109957]